MPSGMDVVVNVTITNVSRQFIRLPEHNRDCDFSTIVKSSAGREAPPTEYLRILNCGASVITGWNGVIDLNPGESHQEDLVVNKLRQMSQPGVYTIQVTRNIPKELRKGPIVSNTLTVTITP
jgi:hypothetical protein